MKMTQIETLTLWDKAVGLWDQHQFDEALAEFCRISMPSSKIFFNIGCAHLSMGNLHEARSGFNSTIEKDEHLAVAYFQRAAVLYQLKRFPDSLLDFEESLRRLRERSHIDYSQLGLRYKLYACECLHNAAVVHACIGNRQQAVHLLEKAQGLKVEKRHTCIDSSMKTYQSGSIPALIKLPADAIFRPPKSKVANIKTKNYLGKAQVVSSVQNNDNFSGFTGPKLRDAGILSTPSNPSSPIPARRKKGDKNSGYKSADNSPEFQKKPILPMRECRSPSLPDILSDDIFLPKRKPLPPTPQKQGPAIFNVEKTVYIEGNEKEPWVLVSKSRPPPPSREPPGLSMALKPPFSNPAVVTSHPPKRPPPKLHGKPLPKLPGDSQSQVSRQRAALKPVAVIPPRKSSPTELNSNPLPLPPRKRNQVKLELHCNSTVVTAVEHGASLVVLMQLAGQQFGMKQSDFDLWQRRASDGEMSRISDESQMEDVWTTVNAGGLTLWCYGKQ